MAFNNLLLEVDERRGSGIKRKTFPAKKFFAFTRLTECSQYDSREVSCLQGAAVNKLEIPPPITATPNMSDFVEGYYLFEIVSSKPNTAGWHDDIPITNVQTRLSTEIVSGI